MVIDEIELLRKLEERHVTVEAIAEIVYDIQENYVYINMSDCIEAVKSVLRKREVQITALFVMQLDIFAEQGLFEEPLNTLITKDKGLFGLDEVVAVGIANLYGSIGFTNFGYLDKIKPRLVGEIDQYAKSGLGVTTFIDDFICAVAAAAAAKLAHSKKPKPRKTSLTNLQSEKVLPVSLDKDTKETITESGDKKDIIPDYNEK